jgi:pentatricopeptide repeat protein
MLAAGLQPNLVTYNTLLEVYAKRGMWREAVGVLDTLEQQVRGRPWQECCCVQTSCIQRVDIGNTCVLMRVS